MNTLLWGMVVLGFLLPILPSLIALVLTLGALEHLIILFAFWGAPVFFVGLCLWTAFPFAVLATFGRIHLRPTISNPPTLRIRTGGVMGSFLAGLALGFWVYFPSSLGGFDASVLLFPLYAAGAMPIGYMVGYTVRYGYDGRKQSGS